MKPEYLQLWQPQASYEQLSLFIEENPNLFALLEETWRKFEQSHTNLFTPQLSHSNYATHITPEQLEHYPVSDKELAEFLYLFDQKNTSNNRPLGDDPEIKDHNWSLIE